MRVRGCSPLTCAEMLRGGPGGPYAHESPAWDLCNSHTRTVSVFVSFPFIPPLTTSPAPGVQHRMPSLARSRLARDVFLVFLGAVSMHFVTTLFHPFDDFNPTWTLQSYHQEEILFDPPPYDEHVNVNKHYNDNPVFDHDRGRGNKLASSPLSTAVTPIDVAKTIPETEIIQHAPGWTMFKNLYMSNGTFFVVSDKPRSEFPELLYILSVPIPASTSLENIQARLPTDQQMDFIDTKDAQWRWGAVRLSEKNRIWSITGNTVCFSLSEFHLISCSSSHPVSIRQDLFFSFASVAGPVAFSASDFAFPEATI